MAQSIRKPAVAGQFYSGDSTALLRDIKQCYDDGAAMAPLTKAEQDPCSTVQAVIVPHAGYVFSGAIAATAFMRISPHNRNDRDEEDRAMASYDRIFLIGPSHHVAFNGASVANVFDAYRTPLGDVPVDTAVCNALIHDNRIFTYKPSAHDREHCLEVQLPLLQYRFKAVPPIVPVIIGTQSWKPLTEIAEALKPYFTPNNLFVISSDFSHYPSYDNALTVDGNTGHALESGNVTDFVDALAKNDSMHIGNLYTSACGQSAIAVLLLLAQDDTSAKDGTTDNGRQPNMRNCYKMHHIAYLNSGDSHYGGKDEVVGYHSFCLRRLNDPTHMSSPKAKGETKALLSDEDKRQLHNVAWNAISPSRLHKKVSPTEIFNRKLGVFVTLNKNGRLRGCIGHFGEDVPLGMLTDKMAHAAAFEDPRFTPLREDELNDIEIEISVLTPLKRIHSISEFQYGKQGIYMRKGWRSGTFLPQVAGEVNWTKEEFLGHCARDKAGIGWDGWKTAELYTYEAIIF